VHVVREGIEEGLRVTQPIEDVVSLEILVWLPLLQLGVVDAEAFR
jgi:hypothetical protein